MLRESGYLDLVVERTVARFHDTRPFAAMMIIVSGALAALVTNDVTLFVVINDRGTIVPTQATATLTRCPVIRLYGYTVIRLTVSGSCRQTSIPRRSELVARKPVRHLHRVRRVPAEPKSQLPHLHRR
jgi:hypothetical protein